MLRDLVSGRDRSPIVCIEDTIEFPGLSLLDCFLANLAKRVDEIHMLCFDAPSHSFTSERLHVHNVFSDTFGWNETPEALNVNTDFISHIQSHSNLLPNQKCAIVINSLTPYILQHGVVKTTQFLHRLANIKLKGEEAIQVVYLLHGDLLDDHSLSLIHHVTTSILKILPSKSHDHYAICDTLHKKSSGKIVKKKEHFNITPSFDVIDFQEVTTTVPMATQPAENQPDPTANLTFNLSLSEKEKRDRSQLILPYTQVKTSKGGPAVPIGQGEGGKIFYQPDEADDFDEEDPDDDLDF